MASVFEGRVVVVTGAARGLGRDYARYLARDGANVVVADSVDGDDAVREAGAEGPRCLFWPTDVTGRSSVHALFDATLAAFGRLDVLINNAGHSRRLERSRLGAPEPGWSQRWEVDVTGSWRCYRAAAPIMAAAGWGRVLNLCAVPAHGEKSPEAQGITRSSR